MISEHHYRQDGLPKGDKQAKSKFIWERLPVDDNGVRWGLIPVTTAFLVTTPTEIKKKVISDNSAGWFANDLTKDKRLNHLLSVG